ncbi:MAG: hypothetical protein WCH74_13410, partial [Chloroflexota bacterium]
TVPGPTVVNPRDITVATTADSTPVSLDVTVRTQLARVYFPCTMGTHYVVGLVTDLSQKSYVAGLYVPNGSGKWTKQVISTLGDSTPKGDGNCWVYFDPKGTTLGKATITIQTAPLLTTPAPTDGTPVTVTTTIPTQNARATFACTKSARYGVELATSLPKSQYVARAYLPTGPDKWENKTFSTTIEVVPKADGTCYVYFDPKGATLATATIMVWGSTAVTADAVTDGTPVTVTTLVPTQNAAVTFPCTNKVRYGIELTSTLPKNGYTVYVLNATSAQQKITPETQSTPGFVGHWVSDSDGSCRIVFNPNGTAVGSATIRIWGVAP